MQSDPSTPAMEVLVVDDDVDIREALSDTLEHRGYAVVTARNGREALDFLRSRRPPAVILLDLMMPVMDGYEFLEARQSDPALSAIPVVIISAGQGVDRARLGTSAPVLSKPVRLAELLATFRQLQASGGLA